MSTKIWQLLLIKADSGLIPRQEWRIVICMVHPMVSAIMLLRRTWKLIIYYTDYHDVDEDRVAATAQDGSWSMRNQVGVALRSLNITSTTTHDDVASSDISKLIKYYADGHDVDEDQATISSQGGKYSNNTQVGIVNRDVRSSGSGNTANASTNVASSRK